ncbi:MAG: hypothetical protein ACFFG0_50195 [Candidatus Thorarchaeota archaeon]
MPFCRNCGTETPEDELRLYSGLCQACHQSQLEDSTENSQYPRFYPPELKHLNVDKSVLRTHQKSFETTPVPSIEEIKRFSKYKSKINIGIKERYLITIIITMILPFLFSFYFVDAIASSLAIDYSYALINTYAIVTLYTNLAYYGIIGLCFLIGGFTGLVQEDSGVILPIGICFSIIFLFIGVILGYILWEHLAPTVFAHLTS